MRDELYTTIEKNIGAWKKCCSRGDVARQGCARQGCARQGFYCSYDASIYLPMPLIC